MPQEPSLLAKNMIYGIIVKYSIPNVMAVISLKFTLDKLTQTSWLVQNVMIEMFPLEEKWILAWDLHSWYLEYFICLTIHIDKLYVVLGLSPFILAFSSTTVLMIHTYKSSANRKNTEFFTKGFLPLGVTYILSLPLVLQGEVVYIYIGSSWQWLHLVALSLPVLIFLDQLVMQLSPGVHRPTAVPTLYSHHAWQYRHCRSRVGRAVIYLICICMEKGHPSHSQY